MSGVMTYYIYAKDRRTFICFEHRFLWTTRLDLLDTLCIFRWGYLLNNQVPPLLDFIRAWKYGRGSYHFLLFCDCFTTFLNLWLTFPFWGIASFLFTSVLAFLSTETLQANFSSNMTWETISSSLFLHL